MADLAYQVRANALEPERVWRLADAALHWTSKHGPQHFDFDKITAIRLEWAPTRANAAQYLCHVSVKSGWTEIIPSTHYAGIMSFQDRAPEYRAFVLALIERVSALNPACKISGGATPFQYLGNVAIIAVSVLMLGVVLLLVGMPLTVIAGVKLLIILFYVPRLLRWFSRNSPGNAKTGANVDRQALQQFLPPQP
jgi:hypothetical protein